MKSFFLTAALLVSLATAANAACTVTTDCGVRTYEDSGVSASISNGVVTVTADGEVIDTYDCASSSISVSCSSTSGDDTADDDDGGFDWEEYLRKLRERFNDRFGDRTGRGARA
ncbi:hypothetical protein [Neolewinella antarctica]|uniref:Opacity protein-like surface antigen n=1 Tax=Neolewinella antarctica TaxID=442734 RepID=A0ABX0XEX1_9BACT|nr:hypothetical protein [Neolewinella antarctica]NJC27762.1 opacity protein-like surface antigen [Neolewinella antarctica]